ncbi:MAG: glycosyltransferase family 2 protein [Pirellulales bacterium]
MKLSVITPSYNQAAYLAATLDSVHSQNYPDLEHWVIDGGSTDGSVAILEDYQQRGLIRYISEPDKGQSDALNKGLARCTGDVICWLNSDDVYAAGTLEFVANFFKENPAESLLTGDCAYMDQAGGFISQESGAGANRESIIRAQCVVYQPSTFFRRSLIESAGGVDTTMHYAMDYDLWLRLTRFARFSYAPINFSFIRSHSECKSMRSLNHDHETWLPEVLRSTRQHWGPRWHPMHWVRRFWISCHCAKVFYGAALVARQEKQRLKFLKYLLKSLRHAPWKLLYWRELGASFRWNWTS